jgi:aldose 1-epimerase
MQLDDQISLRCGAYSVRLAPSAGARMTSLIWNDGQQDRDLLVPCEPAAAFDPHDWPKTGAFPMAPFSNKLEGGRFVWDGREVALPTPPSSPHAMHGLAHRIAWTLSDATPERAVLTYRHAPGGEGWPWAFGLTMDVAVADRGVQVDLQIQNLSPQSMPAGLGWHPFHPAGGSRDTGAHLSLQATACRDAGPEGLAVLTPVSTRLPRQAFEVEGLAPQSTVFEDWGGRFSLGLAEDLAVDVEAVGAAHLFCHVPQHGRHLCLEPVTLLPGALRNYDAAMRASHVALKPGARRAVRWSCSARRVH